jgi:hypothetical protein
VVALRDGRVLVVGGTCGECYLRSAEVFDPRQPEGGAWSSVADAAALYCHFAIGLLLDGRVIVAGGCTSGEREVAVNARSGDCCVSSTVALLSWLGD